MVSARPARAEEPWEAAIRDGIASQDSQIQQSGVKRVISVLEGRASRNPDVVNLYLLARAYAKAKEYPDALAQYPEALKVEPRCYFAHRDLGLIHLELARRTTPPDPVALARADQSLEAARRMKAGYVDALRPLAQVKLDRRDFAGAEVVLQEILDAAPRDDTARVKLVEVQLMKGAPDIALRNVSILLNKDPKNAELRHLKGRVLMARREMEEAKRVFRALAEENPNVRAPYVAYLDAARQSASSTVEEGLWALEGLLRLAKEDDERKRIAAEIDRLRRSDRAAAAPVPTGPPDAETVVKLLNAPDEGQRHAILRWLWNPGPPSGTLELDVVRRGLLPRIVPVYEPVAAHRKWALRLFAKYGGPHMVAVVRLSLKDPDPEVRGIAADTIATLGSLAGVGALARAAQDPEGSVAVAARTALYRLARAASPVAEETPAAQAAAFRAWWEAPEQRDLKRQVVAAILETNDKFAEELLVDFSLDADPAVAAAGYAGLRAVAAAAKGAAPRETWLRELPTLPDGAFEAASGRASREAVAAWWSKRPTA